MTEKRSSSSKKKGKNESIGQKYKLKEPLKPVDRMTRKQLEDAVIKLRQTNGELQSYIAGLRYKLGKQQKKIKSYQLASKTRRLVREASERTGRPPVNDKPWLGMSKEEEERQNIMKPILASRDNENKIENDYDDIDDGDNYGTMSLFKSPSAAILSEREKAKALAAFGGGSSRVPQRKFKKKSSMQLGALYIDIEPLAPSKLKSMLSKEARDSRRYNHESPVRRLQRPKSASASIARKRLEQMKDGFSNMTDEQAAVHLATMDMPFAKRTMDPRLRKSRDKRMKNRSRKNRNINNNNQSGGVASWGRKEYHDVTSMFMVKR